MRQANLRRYCKQSLGIVISIICITIIFRRINLYELKNVILQFHWHFLILGLIFLSFDYCMRILRWAIMLRAAQADVSTRMCAAPFLASIAMNNVLPFRAGDIVRAFVFPAAMGVPRTTATASLLIERLMDLLTLLICLCIGLVLCPIDLPLWMRKSLTVFAIIGGITLLSLIFFNSRIGHLLVSVKNKSLIQPYPKLKTILAIAHDFLIKSGVMLRFTTLSKLFVISLLIWIGETGFFFAMLIGANLPASFAIALLVMAVATLSTLIPSSPGYIGPFHLAIFSVLTLLGSNAEQATSFAVLTHLGLWLSTTIAGVISLAVNPNLFRATPSVEKL